MNETFFVQFVQKLLEEYNHEKPAPMRIGILSVFGKPHAELAHSTMLYSLLKPNQFSVSDFIDTSFLSLIGTACGIDFSGEHIILVEREMRTDKGRSIDLNITTERYDIVIENKIYARDQANQLEDYLDYVERCFNPKTSVLIYLTLYGDTPSEYSIPKKHLNELIDSHRFGAISYEKDILKWLNTIPGKGTLGAELEVYQDTIKELCNMYTDNEAINFGRKYYFEMKDSFLTDSIKANTCVDGIRYIKTTALHLEMLRVLYSFLKANESKNRVIFVLAQSELFSSYDNFEKAVLKTNSPYGLAVDIERAYRIGIEFNPYHHYVDRGKWYFGYMKGNEMTKAAIKYPSNIDDLNLTPDWEDEGWRIVPPSNWWGKSVEVSNLIDNILDTKQISDVAKEVSNWFKNQILYLMKQYSTDSPHRP